MGKNRWVLDCPKRTRVNEQRVSLRILCLPPAGSGGSIFFPWEARLQELIPEWVKTECDDDHVEATLKNVQVLPIELPGRSSRYKEALVKDMVEIVQQIVNGLEEQFLRDDIPFLILGHSFGSWIAFEMTREIEKRGMKRPIALLTSAIRSPRLAGVQNDIDSTEMHSLGEEEFWKKMEERYGKNKELEHPSVRKMMGPILQADFQIAETYAPLPDSRVSCPLFVSGGSEDVRYNEKMLQAWDDCTADSHFTVSTFAGGHSYLFKPTESLDAHLNFLLGAIKECITLDSSQGQGFDASSVVNSVEATVSVSNSAFSETGATVASSMSHQQAKDKHGALPSPKVVSSEADRREQSSPVVEDKDTGIFSCGSKSCSMQ